MAVQFKAVCGLKFMTFWDDVVVNVLGPPICREGDSQDIRHVFSNCTYFPACDQFSLSSVQRGRRLDGEKI